jgi:syntaxin 7
MIHRQEVLLLDNEIAFNEAIIEERDQGILEIQNQIGEVNEIFKDLAVLVHEQGAVIGLYFFHLVIFLFFYLILFTFLFSPLWIVYFLADDIDSNIENAAAATSQAKTHLAKASKTQKSNSSLVIYLSPILNISYLLLSSGVTICIIHMQPCLDFIYSFVEVLNILIYKE